KAIKGHYKLLGTSADDYPELPAFYNKEEIEIKQSEFKALIKKVMFAAAADNLKPVYNGIYIVPESSKRITFVATDSRRLAIIKKEMEVPVEIEEGVIIPLKTIHELFRLLTTEGTCGFSITRNQCFFKIKDTEVMSRVIDGQFPNYKQVIPKDYLAVATVQTDRFLNSLRRAMIFTREPSNRVILHFSREKLVIEAKTPDLGEAEEEIQIESTLKDSISIGINAQFLLEALREMESNTVAVGITGQMSPLTISPDNNRDYISVIMPVKIKSSDED
ncbi:MAG: DNA polymerase III subunit beta, partial [Spirochaetes bacterium]|nr:DNA polymerase III subunit beta [Spirochaetota bacterium]